MKKWNKQLIEIPICATAAFIPLIQRCFKGQLLVEAMLQFLDGRGFISYAVESSKNKLIAMCGVYDFDDHEKGLCWFCVHPNWRRMGIASYMLKEMEYLADNKLVIITYPRLKNAIAFYESKGYEISEVDETDCGKELILRKE